MLGVVGAGRWGRNHIRNFAALGVLNAVCDTSQEALDRTTGELCDVTAYRELADLLGDGRVKAVVIATPAEVHFGQTKAALAAGRHVLVEKPMTLSLAEAQVLDRMAAERRLVLMVGHLLEYHPAFVALRKLVSGGELGRLQRLQARRLIPGVSGRREGVLWDLGPHDLSMMVRLLDALPERVEASATEGERASEAVAIRLAFPGGVEAQTLLGWRHQVKEQLLAVVGERAAAVFDDTAQEGKLRVGPAVTQEASRQRLARSGSDRRPAPDDLRADAWPLVLDSLRPVAYPDGEPLRRECEHFLRCVAEGERPLTDGASGVRVARVLDACERSLRAGGAPVELRHS